ncbi:hypothetical protein E4U56_007254 [Claviceps arundinis]|uniref:Uncharacterized protein n=1 Tax=Claviceps arundinis TaxID=1623583 RepID=A0A9P7MKR5_9HYPO|nr:hypothetical protein E4U56_007254 [Claviceps arundinis]
MWETFNHPQSVPSFNGTGDIGGWFKTLIRDYRHANGNKDPSPSCMIQALDNAIVGDAGTFVGSNPLLAQIVEQADAFTATAEDLALFRCTLQDYYGIKSEVAAVHGGPIPHVVQGDRESLDAYHGRVLSVFRARGGRDKPISADQPPLTTLEVSSLSDWVYLFVRGLQNKSLAHEAIDHGVLLSDSFRSAFQIVKESSGRLDVKANMARQMAQQARNDLIDGWFRQQFGHSANEELSRAYGLPSSLFDAYGRPCDPAVPAQPFMSAQGTSGGWNYHQPNQVHCPPVPQQGYAYWPQQANVFQPAPAFAPTPAFAPAPVYAPAPVPAPAYIPSPAPVAAHVPVYSPAPVPVRARYTTVDVSDLCPSMEYEETEFIAPEPVEDECPTFEAVDVSHAAVETGVNPLPFQHHEQEDATVENVIVIEDAAVQDAAVEEDIVENVTAAEEVTDVEDVDIVEKVTDVEDVATVEDVIVVEDVDIVEKVTDVEDVDVVEKVTTVEDVDIVENVTTVEDVIPIEDAVVVEDITAVEDVTVEDASVEEDIVENVVTVEDVTDEDLPLPLIQSLEGVDEDIPESVAQDGLWAMTLISEASPPLDKWESMSVTDMIDEDEIPLPLSVPLVREKTVKGNARAFSEIWGCEGIGPVVLKGLVAFLMQPWMINRELPTQVRKLSRIIIPKKRLRKKKVSYSLRPQPVLLSTYQS